MRKTITSWPFCLLGIALITTSCGGGSDTTPTTEPASETSTTQVPKLELSRETLVALEKCTSDSFSAYMWALDDIFADKVADVADLCTEARDQLEVDKQLNPDFDYDIQTFIVSLGIWIVELRRAVVDLSIGQEADLAALQNGGSTIIARSEAFLEKLKP